MLVRKENEIIADPTFQAILQGVVEIIEHSRQSIAVYVNQEITMMHWHVGKFVLQQINYEDKAEYGKKIMATLSQQLTWSQFVELITIEQEPKRLFYQQMSIRQRWSSRQLRKYEDAMLYERSLIAAKPEDKQIAQMEDLEPGELTPDMVLRSSYVLDCLGLSGYYSEKDLENAILQQMERFILELGQGFAFMERQKRISVDGIDYYIDLLFYHRTLNRLVAIDLKLGKFKPEYKGQMELYLKYLQRYEQRPNEQSPIGLLLCSEGNSEHVELMMLDEDNIHVAQYLTELPDKQWFIDRLNRSIAIAAEHKNENKLNN